MRKFRLLDLGLRAGILFLLKAFVIVLTLSQIILRATTLLLTASSLARTGVMSIVEGRYVGEGSRVFGLGRQHLNFGEENLGSDFDIGSL